MTKRRLAIAQIVEEIVEAIAAAAVVADVAAIMTATIGTIAARPILVMGAPLAPKHLLRLRRAGVPPITVLRRATSRSFCPASRSRNIGGWRSSQALPQRAGSRFPR